MTAESWKVNALFYLFVFQDTSRRYENKAGAFITGIDVNSKVHGFKFRI